MQFRGNCASCFVFLMSLSYGSNKFSFGQTGAAGDAAVTALPIFYLLGFIAILLAWFTVIYAQVKGDM